MRLDHNPLRIGQISLITQPSCGYAALGWSASTWRLQIGLNNLPGIHIDTGHSTPFETAS